MSSFDRCAAAKAPPFARSTCEPSWPARVVVACWLWSCGPRPDAASPPVITAGAPSAASRAAKVAPAATALGKDLPLRSSGTPSGDAWQLSNAGYVASYLRLEQAGSVKLTVSASGNADSKGAPELELAIADVRRSFEVASNPGPHELDVALPPGTYIARIGFTNGVPDSTRQLTVHQLDIQGASLLGEHTDQNALDAANTYIHHFRRGPAKLELEGAPPGSPVKISLVDHAFGFGANVPFAENKLIPAVVPPGSDAERFQRLLLSHFNTVVLSNGGKWVYHEPTRDQVELAYVDRFLAFVRKEGLKARMHTLLWDTEQQPAWVVSEDSKSPGLLSRAHAGDAAAKRELLEEVAERIDYYVKERATGYSELDVINESLHRPRYVQALGVEGIAALFGQCAAAVQAAGARTRLYLNEYNLLQWSVDPLGNPAEPDPYANWYRWHAEAVMRAGGPVSGLGVQYYADGRLPAEIAENAHSPARIMGVLQNLAGVGLPLTLSEFAVNAGNLPKERGADVLEETLRLAFGTPEVGAFLMWAVWANAAQKPPPLSILVDEKDELTPAGRRYESLMKEWSTELETALGSDGSVEFVGFFGDYAVEVAGQTRCFTLSRGAAEYTLAAPAPSIEGTESSPAQRCRVGTP